MTNERITHKHTDINTDANKELNQHINKHRCTTFKNYASSDSIHSSGVLSLYGLHEFEKPALAGILKHSGMDSILEDTFLKQALQDLPVMSEPLAFLNYVASDHLDPCTIEHVVAALADSCQDMHIPLIGVETASLPGILKNGTTVLGALFNIGESNNLKYIPHYGLEELKILTNPAIAFSIGGVGDKARIGVRTPYVGRLIHDIVNRSVNDIMCEGAKPVAFMPYIGCHDTDPTILSKLLEGIVRDAEKNSLTILDMVLDRDPDRYQPGGYNICGCMAGITNIVTPEQVKEGDYLIGLRSNGLHTDGYSLAHRCLIEKAGLRLKQPMPGRRRTLGDELTLSHKNYAHALLPLVYNASYPGAVKAMTQVTGGGIPDNLARMLPEGTGAEINLGSWKIPYIFRLIQKSGDMSYTDPDNRGMFETFNMGIGMILITDWLHRDYVLDKLKGAGEKPVNLGRVTRTDAEDTYKRIKFVGV